MVSAYSNASRVINHCNSGSDKSTAESILRKQMLCTDNGTRFGTHYGVFKQYYNIPGEAKRLFVDDLNADYPLYYYKFSL